jgi:hypothetical protein
MAHRLPYRRGNRTSTLAAPGRTRRLAEGYRWAAAHSGRLARRRRATAQAAGSGTGRRGWRPRAIGEGSLTSARRLRDRGLAVDETVEGPVENPSGRGITAGEMWTDVWIRKFPEIAAANLLCWPSWERKNSLVAGNGDQPGETSATREGPGNREFRRVSGPGDRLGSVRGRATGRSARQNRAGPSISCMEGPCHFCARNSVINPAGVISRMLPSSCPWRAPGPQSS